MHRGRIDFLDEVIVARGAGLHSNAASSLSLELCQWSPLDVPHVAECDNNFVVCVEVFRIEFFCTWHDFRLALIAKLFLHFNQFVLDHLLAEIVVRQNLIVVFYLFFQFIVLVVQVFLTQACQLTQAHVDDSLTLQLVQLEANLQVALGIRRGLATADDMNHLINIV